MHINRFFSELKTMDIPWHQETFLQKTLRSLILIFLRSC